MLPKFLIGVSISIIILGLLAVPVGIYSSFVNMKNAETEGISAVTNGITTALLGSLSAMAGGILLAIGAILFNKRKRNLPS